ncbi:MULTISPECIES: hypothetical protein [Arthrobacter]|uniref:hypothetical protein n=1 Tax=Arthrobacter TaxID=1663 RepID=UPI0006DAD2C5|nr:MULTISPECIES: hypothetical protein [unclassified Arthrobacter]KPN18279.1 hypothetical protein AO716_10480 [Arthrobacter sp. Edens01]MSR99965.1 hypothetical protein [Arthrobacter sp. BL-252-APC-1A]
MIFTSRNRARNAAAAGVIALSLLGATGCSAVNDQATTMEYSPSDGIVQDLGDLQLRNILVVSEGDGEPGRLMGTVINDSADPINFELSVGGSNLSWNIPGGGKVVYDDAPQAEVLVEAVNVLPGTGIRAEAKDGSETATLNLPVVDGQVSYYEDYLPTPEPTPSEEPAAEATETPAP